MVYELRSHKPLPDEAQGKPLSRLTAEARKEQLLRIACETFAEQGFHGSSMEEIAEAAGVTKPVIYQHFSSKRALYLELLGVVDEELSARLLSATAEATTGRERVERGFAEYFRFAADSPSSFRILFGASVRNDQEFSAVADRAIDRISVLISALIEIDVPDAQRRVLAHAIVGMAEATSRTLATDGEIQDPDLLASWLAEMAWFGLRGVRTE